MILFLTSHMTARPLSLLSQTLEKFWLAVFFMISLLMVLFLTSRMMGVHLIFSKL